MEELRRSAAELTMSPRRQVSFSATGASDWSAEEARPARATRLDKYNAKRLCEVCRERKTWAESVTRKSAPT